MMRRITGWNVAIPWRRRRDRSASDNVVARAAGAPQRTNLEPSDVAELLSELEGWSEVLKAEPEVIHRLAAFSDSADSGDPAPVESGPKEDAPPPDTLPEPSP